MILVRYKEDDTFEGYVETKIEFNLWLKKHNKQRKTEGEIIEYADEFELKEISGLVN